MSIEYWPEFLLLIRAKLVLQKGFRRDVLENFRTDARKKYSMPSLGFSEAMISAEVRNLKSLALLDPRPNSFFECLEGELHGGFDREAFKPRKNRIEHECDEEEIAVFKKIGEKEYLKRFNLKQYAILLRHIGDLQKQATHSEDDMRLLRWFHEWDKAFLKVFADWGIDVSQILPDDKAKKEKYFFEIFEKLSWAEISFVFISTDMLRVEARRKHGHFTCVELGFEDKRKKIGDTRWEILRDDFASNSGVVTRKTRQTPYDNFISAVYEINKRLKVFFGIEENPFYYNKYEKAYETKLKAIRDAISYPNSAE